MTVIWTGALASACAAFNPPNPAPTITTRGIAGFAISPSRVAVARSTSIRFSPMADGSSNSMGKQTPAWIRVVMPSGADLIFVALLSALVFTPLSMRLLGDAGIGWHIRTGQQILATHAIPPVDLFSSTMTGKPWFAWVWLYDLGVGQLAASLGLNWEVWLTALVIAAVFAWTFRFLIARGTKGLVALPVVLLAVRTTMIHFLRRPHVVSWLFTLAWFWILDSSEREGFDGRGGPEPP